MSPDRQPSSSSPASSPPLPLTALDAISPTDAGSARPAAAFALDKEESRSRHAREDGARCARLAFRKRCCLSRVSPMLRPSLSARASRSARSCLIWT